MQIRIYDSYGTFQGGILPRKCAVVGTEANLTAYVALQPPQDYGDFVWIDSTDIAFAYRFKHVVVVGGTTPHVAKILKEICSSGIEQALLPCERPIIVIR